MPTIKIKGLLYDLDAPLFGAKQIAKIRNQSERQVFHAAAEGRFTFRKDGRLIVSTPREALEPLLGADGITRLIVAEQRGQRESTLALSPGAGLLVPIVTKAELDSK